MKHIQVFLFTFLLLTLLFLSQTGKAVAFENTSGISAKLATGMQKQTDTRVKTLTAFLEKYNSPLVPHAGTFISEADKHNLDWKLVVSIAGIESTFGKRIPYNSYNAWGFGVYGDNVLRFQSWDDGIATVSKSLRQNYMNKWNAKDIHEIGRIYAASPTWAQKVTYFMNQIEDFEASQNATLLSISL